MSRRIEPNNQILDPLMETVKESIYNAANEYFLAQCGANHIDPGTTERQAAKIRELNARMPMWHMYTGNHAYKPTDVDPRYYYVVELSDGMIMVAKYTNDLYKMAPLDFPRYQGTKKAAFYTFTMMDGVKDYKELINVKRWQRIVL